MTEDFVVEVNTETIHDLKDRSEFVLAVVLDYEQSSGLAWA